MPLIRAHQISLSYGEFPLLDNVSFCIEPRDRIAIIGRNGVGKSTLLKIISQEITPDSGNLEYAHIKIAQLQQQVPTELTGSVYEFVDAAHSKEHEWDSTHLVDRVISQLQLNPEAELTSLSGGQLRRCLLAKALVNEPDVLILDEPTNHLDLTTILWLEGFLLQSQMTLIFVTHDRSFMQNVANRIMEIDRGNIISWSGDYLGFLRHKEQQLAAEQQHHAKFDKRLAQEEVWIRQGIKARRTRNEGRVRALKKMRQERAMRQKKVGQISLHTEKAHLSGQQIFVIDNITVQYNQTPIIRDFSCIITRGDKIGIIGPNGCGKSTLLRALLGEITLDAGEIQRGTQLDIAYFDQHRSTLDPNQCALDVVSQGREFITINGENKHVISYMQEFLFTPEKARSPVRTFSGGECNRLVLAKLLSTPTNLLVMDEPTNDLDVETLELLEEYLVNYTGTLLLISHDRTFLNNVATSTLVFGDGGHITEYIGGYDDCLQSHLQNTPATPKEKKVKEKKISNKLSYNETKELKKLPNQIENKEALIDKIHQAMSESDFYQQNQTSIKEKQQELTIREEELAKLYARWEELTLKQEQS